MFSMPGIVIVDNNSDELEKLRDAFFNSGLPCLPIKYKSDDPSDNSGIDHINIPETLHTRILITDLNLHDQTKLDATNLLGPIATVIKKLAKSGPYLLIIWSRHLEQPQQVMELLEQRFRDQLLLPVEWKLLNKLDFLSPEQGGDKANAEKLRQKVLQLVEQSPLFHALLDWEGRVAEAARKTTDALYNISKPTQNDQQNYIEEHRKSISQVLAAVGNEAFGKTHAGASPTKSLDTGLGPVLSDQLHSSNSLEVNDRVWKAALPDLGRNVALPEPIKHKLNAFCHIEKSKQDFPKNFRGIFVSLNDAHFTDPIKKKKIERRLGRKIETIIYDEFLNCDYPDKDQRNAALSEVKLGFLEVSAECDHAQNKTKLHRYILGALIPYTHSKVASFGLPDAPRRTMHGGIYRFPTIALADGDYIFKLSFKYQIGAHPDNSWFGKPLFRVREQILTEISFLCSQYYARPGIIQFN